MVERLLGASGIQPADSVQKSYKFLVFGVHADDGIGRILKLFAVVGEDFKLAIAAQKLSEWPRFASLATA